MISPLTSSRKTIGGGQCNPLSALAGVAWLPSSLDTLTQWLESEISGPWMLDTSQTGDDRILNGGPGLQRGQCLELGTANYVNLGAPKPSDIDYGDEETIYSGFLRFRTTNTGTIRLLVTGGGGSAYCLNIYLVSGFIQAVVRVSGSGPITLTSTANTYNNGVYHSVLVVADRVNDLLSLYIDGVFDKSMAIPTGGTAKNSSEAWWIGSQYNSVGADIFDVRLFGSDVSGAALGMHNFTAAPATDGWWKLDEQSGVTAYDSSGNGNHGTLINSPSYTTQDVKSFQNDVGYSYRGNLEYYSEDWTYVNGGPTGLASATADSVTFATGAGYYYKNVTTNVSPSDVCTARITLRSSDKSTISVRWYSGNSAYHVVNLTTSWQTIEIVSDPIFNNYFSIGLDNRTAFGGDELAGTVEIRDIQVVANEADLSEPPGYVKTTGTEVLPAFIPRDESNTAQDVLGNALTYAGSAPRHGQLSSACGTFDGVDDYGQVSHHDDLDFSEGQTIKISGRVYASDFSTGSLQTLAYKDRQYNPRISATGEFQFAIPSVSGGPVSGIYFVDGEWNDWSVEYDTNANTVTFTVGDNSATVAMSDSPNAAINAALYVAGNTSSNLAGRMAELKVEIDSDTKAHWTWIEKAGPVIYDVSGNGHNMTIMNAVLADFWANTQTVFAHGCGTGYSGAMYIEGYSQRVGLGYQSIPSGDYTFSVWLNISPGTVHSYPVRWGGLRLHIVHGSTCHLYHTAPQASWYFSDIRGGWHHIAIKTAGDTTELFIDNVSQGAVTGITPASTASVDSSIGLSNGFLNASVFDARIYHEELSDSAIEYIYTDGSSGVAPSSANLVGWYKLDSGDVLDSSGNGNDGINIGAVPHYIPRDESDTANDVIGNALSHPAGFNGASDLDHDPFTIPALDPGNLDGMTPPAAHALGDAVVDAAQHFIRQTATKEDRFLLFSEDLVEPNLSKANSYTA